MISKFEIKPNLRFNSIKPYHGIVPTHKSLQTKGKIKNLIKLSNNENQLGASPKVLMHLKESGADIHFYPDDNGVNLKNALAKHWNINVNQIALGAGSNQLLWLIAQTFVEPNDEVIIPQYSFFSYYYAAIAAGANPVVVPTTNWKYNIAAILDAINSNTKLIYIANPNNPTGSWINQQSLKSFLQDVPSHILVIIDEAYYEYIDNSDFPDSLYLQRSFPNVIITRTFSKAYGLAGLRIGYSISDSNIASFLNNARDIFNVNSQALIAAQIALKDQDHILLSRTLNQQGLEQLKSGLKILNIKYLATITNFITIYLGQYAQKIYQILLENGIIVCSLNNYDLPSYLRITVGTLEQNASFLKALALALKTVHYPSEDTR